MSARLGSDGGLGTGCEVLLGNCATWDGELGMGLLLDTQYCVRGVELDFCFGLRSCIFLLRNSIRSPRPFTYTFYL